MPSGMPGLYKALILGFDQKMNMGAFDKVSLSYIPAQGGVVGYVANTLICT